MSTTFAGLTPRPDQIKMVNDALQSKRDGFTRTCMHAPTGFGKSLVQFMLADKFLRQGKQVAIMSPRVALVDSAVSWAEDSQIPFSVRHDSYKDYRNDSAGLYICSIQTELSARSDIRKDELDVDAIIIDEAHLGVSEGTETCSMLSEHNINGTDIFGFTATPLEISHFYETLKVGPTPTELFDSKVLVPCRYYDGGDPSLEHIGIKRHADGEFNKKELRKFGYTQMIFGSVWENFKQQNPDLRPWFVFANGVEESIEFCDMFNRKGVPAVHFDGQQVYMHGKLYRDKMLRFQILKEMKEGTSEFKVVCSRFVLREGVDLPNLYGMSLATPMGSLKTFIQTCGRGARSAPGKTFYKVIDHGGNRFRFGSPNADIDWLLYWDLKPKEIENLFRERCRANMSDAGHTCRECGRVYKKLPESGKCECGASVRHLIECPRCGLQHKIMPVDCSCIKCGQNLRTIRKKRVIQSDGVVKFVPDDQMVLPDTRIFDGTEKLWTGSFFGAFKSKKEKYKPEVARMNTIRVSFQHKHREKYHGIEAPAFLPNMPVSPDGWYIRLDKVKWSDLIDRVAPDGSIVAKTSDALVIDSIKKPEKNDPTLL